MNQNVPNGKSIDEGERGMGSYRILEEYLYTMFDPFNTIKIS